MPGQHYGWPAAEVADPGRPGPGDWLRPPASLHERRRRAGPGARPSPRGTPPPPPVGTLVVLGQGGHGGGRHHPASECGGGAVGGGRRDRIGGHGGQLAQEVDQLFGVTDEVAGGQLGPLEDTSQPFAPGPAPGHLGEAEIGQPGAGQTGLFLVGPEASARPTRAWSRGTTSFGVAARAASGRPGPRRYSRRRRRPERPGPGRQRGRRPTPQPPGGRIRGRSGPPGPRSG